MNSETPQRKLKSPFQLRAEALARIKAWMLAFFECEPRWNSVLLSVAQYWNDEANDATHFELMASANPTPLWTDEEWLDEESNSQNASIGIWNYGNKIGPFPMDENSSAIRPFQALCREGGSQEYEMVQNYLPAFLFRRDGSVFSVGHVERPWLDLPRAQLPSWEMDTAERQSDALPALQKLSGLDRKHLEAIAQDKQSAVSRQVYADALVAKGDARGGFMSLCLAERKTSDTRNQAREWLLEHGESWLGDLVHIVPLASCDFTLGILTGCAVHFESEYLKLAQHPLFLNVTALHVASGVECLSPSMRSLTSLTGLKDLRVLNDFVGLSTIRHLGIRTTQPMWLASLRMLALEQLDVGTEVSNADVTVPRTLANLRQTAPLHLFRVMLDFDIPVAEGALDEVYSLRALVDAAPQVSRLSLCGMSPASRPTGFQLEFSRANPEQVKLSCLGFGYSSRLSVLRAHLHHLPLSIKRIVWEESVFFTPSNQDLENFAAWSGCELVSARLPLVADLTQRLEAALAFSQRVASRFAEAFEVALWILNQPQQTWNSNTQLEAALEAAQQHGFSEFAMSNLKQSHRFFVATATLTREAARLEMALRTAHVFGGMGSWNDQVFEAPHDDLEFQSVGGALLQSCEALRRALAGPTLENPVTLSEERSAAING
jgi:hypothetical protein